MRKTQREEIARLAGGGRSRVRTFLRPKSLLTGKNTGNITRFIQALRSQLDVEECFEWET